MLQLNEKRTELKKQYDANSAANLTELKTAVVITNFLELYLLFIFNVTSAI